MWRVIYSNYEKVLQKQGGTVVEDDEAITYTQGAKLHRNRSEAVSELRANFDTADHIEEVA